MVIVFLANGFEESEAIITVDVLKRAGLDVKTVSLYDTVGVSSCHELRLYADWTTTVVPMESDAYDLVVLPGGMPGALNLANNEYVKNCVMYAYNHGKTIAAICAAPTAFGKWGLLDGKKATCYPGCEGELKGAEIVNAKVVVDGNIVTGKGPGATFDFAFALVEKMCGKAKADELKAGMIY